MLDSRAPVMRLAVFLAILSLITLALVAGCKKGPDAESARLTLGGEDALEDEGGETAAAQGVEEGEAVDAAESAPAAGGGRQGRGGGRGGGRRGGGAAVETAEATPEPAASGGGGRGGRGGRGGGGRGAATAAAAESGAAGAETAAVGEATAEAGAEAAEEQPAASAATGIPEVDKMSAVREFAALYGPTTLIKAKDWNDTELEWVSLTAEEGKAKGKQIVMPVSMVTGAKYLEVLDGYFPIYVRGARPLGEIGSRETITVARKQKRSVEEIRALEEGARARVAAAEAAAAAEAGEAAGAGPAAGGMRAGGMGGGMRGGRGGRGGMRGGR